ncbi:MAG: CPBP family glutamic-type intramembrane protease [Candidatus Binatus sp.]|uniref:CPBP family glutamic-type intramembrane protease n=1 Tax=Candidatus Binatus sp. TaxID=2811406 RepID=UPI003BB12BCA
MHRSFTARFALVLVAGIVAAIIVAPLVAIAVSAVGLRYPFPRIFDRTVMATLLIAMLFSARDLNLVPLLRRGFKHPLAISIARAIRGFGVAMLSIAILFGLALAVGGGGVGDHEAAAALIPKYFLSAIAIAFIEEAFFRAFLLGGMARDFGNRIALIASAAIYAIAHLVRSPARFYVTGYQPAAGLITLAHSIDQFKDPGIAIPALIGLFLLGIVLGEAYILTGSVYFSIGLHCGFVLGAKMWPKIILNRAAIPWWIAGGGAIPLIGGATAWVIAIAILATLRPIAGVQKAALDVVS